MTDLKRKKVLILCTGNSTRSIMAEFMINHELGNQWQAFSAGVEPASPRPQVLRALAEIGISHEGARSKPVTEFLDRDDLDLVITVCDHARETCPVFFNPVEQVHIGIEDPSLYADEADEIAMTRFREARNAIFKQIVGYLKSRL